MVFSSSSPAGRGRATSVLLALLLFCAPTLLKADDPVRNRILILHSYSENFSWTSEINHGLERWLNNFDSELWFAYMDVKRFNSTPYFDSLADFYRGKYADQYFDLIITIDNSAYDFMIQYRDEIFHNAPAISIGLNNHIPPKDREDNIYYIEEHHDFRRTLDLAYEQNKGAQKIYIILDQTPTGRAIRGQLTDILPDDYPEIVWIDEGSAEELRDAVAAIPPGEILLYILYYHTTEEPVEGDIIARLVTQAAQVPVYCLWSFALADGALGGYLYDGKMLGETAGAIASEGLSLGMADWSGYDDSGQGQYLVNFPVAMRYGLAASDFPRNTRYIDRPANYFTENPVLVIVVGLIFLILILIIIIIQYNLTRQQEANRMKSEQIQAQKEIMLNLGTIIETRSNETGAHLRRITAITLYVARTLGLPEDMVDALYFGAALHDVGKVGIPDSILNKAGPLTPEERAIINTHPEKGFTILDNSGNKHLKLAAVIARDHHEYWNGSGYPSGKSGGDIHILARIVTIIDVMDALLSDRVYKVAWSPEDVRDYISKNSGILFDPRITSLVLSHWEHILGIWGETTEQSS